MAAAQASAAARHIEGLPRLIALDPRAISIAEGLRAALSVAVIVAANAFVQWPPLMEAALAALLTCLCDAGGPIRRRLPALLIFGVVGALLTAGFGLARGLPLPMVVPLASLGVFCLAFVRSYGQSAMQVGNLLTVVLVLALTRTVLDLGEAAALAGTFWLGSLWALLLTMVIWRLNPYLPARQSVANVYRALAILADDMRHLLRHESPHETMWDRHAREHRRLVRQAIEQARASVLAAVQVRGPITGRAAQSLIRLEAADQMFGALIALSDLLSTRPDAETQAAAGRLLRLLRPLLVLLARSIVTDAPAQMPWIERVTATINHFSGPPESNLHRIGEVIAEQLRVALTLALPDGASAATMGGDSGGGRESLLAPIRANLRPDSEVLRHAARAAVVSLPAFAITLHWPGTYEHWLTIMLVLTMQPYFALTFTRAVERIGGTVLGGAVAALLAVVCTTPLSIAAALFPLAVIALSVRAVSFGLFMACLTPLVVLLSEIGRPGESELHIAAMRALYALIGGTLAVVGSYLLWPLWEPERLRREIFAAIEAHGRYACTEIEWWLGEAPQEAVEQARRDAGRASNNVEASLQRALLEPVGGNAERLEAALTIDAAMRRMAGRLAALQIAPMPHPRDPSAWRAWRDWIKEATTRLASGDPDLPPRPKLPEDDPDTLGRIVRQLTLVAAALARAGRP